MRCPRMQSEPAAFGRVSAFVFQDPFQDEDFFPSRVVMRSNSRSREPRHKRNTVPQIPENANSQTCYRSWPPSAFERPDHDRSLVRRPLVLIVEKACTAPAGLQTLAGSKTAICARCKPAFAMNYQLSPKNEDVVPRPIGQETVVLRCQSHKCEWPWIPNGGALDSCGFCVARPAHFDPRRHDKTPNHDSVAAGGVKTINSILGPPGM